MFLMNGQTIKPAARQIEKVERHFDFLHDPSKYEAIINQMRRTIGGPALNYNNDLWISDNDPTYFDYEKSRYGIYATVDIEVDEDVFYAYAPWMEWNSTNLGHDEASIILTGQVSLVQFPVKTTFNFKAVANEQAYEDLVALGKIHTEVNEPANPTMRTYIACGDF